MGFLEDAIRVDRRTEHTVVIGIGSQIILDRTVNNSLGDLGSTRIVRVDTRHVVIFATKRGELGADAPGIDCHWNCVEWTCKIRAGSV